MKNHPLQIVRNGLIGFLYRRAGLSEFCCQRLSLVDDITNAETLSHDTHGVVHC